MNVKNIEVDVHLLGLSLSIVGELTYKNNKRPDLIVEPK